LRLAARRADFSARQETMTNTTPTTPHDLLVIGGGINGVGIGRDAAGRGLKVLLCERDDLASHTSSAATKLIHGGLRYLEYYEFRLVREALAEREVLLKLAPHIIWPLRFVLPHDTHLRPAWMIRAGLFMYDHLSRLRSLPGTESVNLRQHPVGQPLKPDFTRGFIYSDCWVDDARLVSFNAQSIRELGGTVLTRTACIGARRDGELWRATLRDMASGTTRDVSARAIVNAAGPWVREVVTGALGFNVTNNVRLIKGSHIVVPRLFEGPQCYIFQHPDKRVIFAIPYEDRFTLVGTTDIPLDGEPRKPEIDAEEISYLCDAVSRYFSKRVTPAEVAWTYSGVRPLYDDGQSDPSAVTRDYVLDLDDKGPPALSVYGGKITTYRRLAEQAMEKLAPFFPGMGASWTAGGILPGGDLKGHTFEGYVEELRRRHPLIDGKLLHDWARRYGSLTEKLIGEARSMSDLGEDFGGSLFEREVEYLVEHEWARGVDDVLWRRTKRGLHMPPGGAQRLAGWFAARAA